MTKKKKASETEEKVEKSSTEEQPKKRSAKDIRGKLYGSKE